MADLTCTPANRASVVAGAQGGDTIIHAPGTYPAWTWRAGLTYRAADHEPWKAIDGTRGHYGAGFACRITQPDISINDPSLGGMKWEGFWHDVRGDGNTGFTNNLVVKAPGFEARDFCVTAKKANGGRNIYCTPLLTSQGAGVIIERFRINGVGQPNQSLDHAFYFECPAGWGGPYWIGTPAVTVREFIITEGGAYPMHFFPAGSGIDISRGLIYKARRGTTFSGSQSTSYAAELRGTSHHNRIRYMLWSDRAEAGGSWAHIEYYREAGAALPYENHITDSAVYRGNGEPTTHNPDGVTLGCFDFANTTLNNTLGQTPGYADPDNGDFRLSTSSRAYLDALSRGTQVGPTTIQPGGASTAPIISSGRETLTIITLGRAAAAFRNDPNRVTP